MIIELAGRKLLLIDNDDRWDELPKNVRGLPVYFRRTPTGIDVWPIWEDYVVYPDIRINP